MPWFLPESSIKYIYRSVVRRSSKDTLPLVLLLVILEFKYSYFPRFFLNTQIINSHLRKNNVYNDFDMY